MMEDMSREEMEERVNKFIETMVDALEQHSVHINKIYDILNTQNKAYIALEEYNAKLVEALMRNSVNNLN